MSKEYRVDLLSEEADIEAVAEYIGIETRRMGGHTSILCPCHSDKHYGSCYLGRYKFRSGIKDGFRCYSCGAKGDAIDLVREHCNVGLKEAMGIVASVCGDRNRYLLNQSEKAALEYEERTMVKVLPDDKLRLIGIAVPSTNNGISISVAAYPTAMYYQLQKEEKLIVGAKEHTEWYPNEDDGLSVIMRCVDRNPLRTLANEDYDVYSEIVCGKCHEAIEKYQNMISYAKRKNDGGEVGYYCRKLSNECGIGLFVNVCQEKIREIEDILIDFGERKKHSQNMFGKITKGAALV